MGDRFEHRRSRSRSPDRNKSRSHIERDRPRYTESSRRKHEEEYSESSRYERRKHDDKRDYERRKYEEKRIEHRTSRPEDAEALLLERSKDEGEEKTPQEKVNYKQSGLLAKETNTVNGSVLKYQEPEDAHLPETSKQYRLVVFEGDDIVKTVKLNQSLFLLGRDPNVCHIVLDTPSCSKQHAAIQFRAISKRDKYGETTKQIKAYIIDLESSYGTKLNNDDIPTSRFIELRTKDVLQFGGVATRDYVFIVN
ncbi:hypothetical protein TRVA0_048S00650 [Trichomonascus vanleenenianus]|uniref:Pml1p n=1 Tax=Trichomonascus vanleenenianus TaxID=2268995 RepID=UPI003ECAA38D